MYRGSPFRSTLNTNAFKVRACVRYVPRQWGWTWPPGRNTTMNMMKPKKRYFVGTVFDPEAKTSCRRTERRRKEWYHFITLQNTIQLSCPKKGCSNELTSILGRSFSIIFLCFEMFWTSWTFRDVRLHSPRLQLLPDGIDPVGPVNPGRLILAVRTSLRDLGAYPTLPCQWLRWTTTENESITVGLMGWEILEIHQRDVLHGIQAPLDGLAQFIMPHRFPRQKTYHRKSNAHNPPPLWSVTLSLSFCIDRQLFSIHQDYFQESIRHTAKV